MRAIPLAFLAASLVEVPAQQPLATLPESAFRELHAQVVPTRTEPWETIPWRTGLAAARREAGDRGVPLFLWTMNGHPLGCT